VRDNSLRSEGLEAPLPVGLTIIIYKNHEHNPNHTEKIVFCRDG
jgi:hypothetical protein